MRAGHFPRVGAFFSFIQISIPGPGSPNDRRVIVTELVDFTSSPSESVISSNLKLPSTHIIY